MHPAELRGLCDTESVAWDLPANSLDRGGIVRASLVTRSALYFKVSCPVKA